MSHAAADFLLVTVFVAIVAVVAFFNPNREK